MKTRYRIVPHIFGNRCLGWKLQKRFLWFWIDAKFENGKVRTLDNEDGLKELIDLIRFLSSEPITTEHLNNKEDDI